MQRRRFNRVSLDFLGLCTLLAWRQAQALSLGELSNADVSSGIKAALARGADIAIQLLGRTDGFLGNPNVRIGLPGDLDQVASAVLRADRYL